MKAYNEWISYDLHTAILAMVGFFIQFYNYERIQLKTKLTPYERRCQFV